MGVKLLPMKNILGFVTILLVLSNVSMFCRLILQLKQCQFCRGLVRVEQVQKPR